MKKRKTKMLNGAKSIVRTHGRSTLFIRLFSGIIFFVLSITSHTVNANSSEDIIKRLQGGGYVLYLRHAATDRSQSDIDLNDLKKCELQRNLSNQGKEETKVLKAALFRLKIKIGNVYTSPYCRAIDTAKIGFGTFQIDPNLRATFYTDKSETDLLSIHLKARLSEFPLGGTNTVLVSHTANLRDLTNVWPKPEGVVHVFKPLGLKGYLHIGQIAPLEWAFLAGLN